jgi:hypothetical protein
LPPQIRLNRAAISFFAPEELNIDYLASSELAKTWTIASANRRTELSLILPSETAVLISGSFRPADVVTMAEMSDGPRTRTSALNASPGSFAAAALRMAEQM